MEETENRPESPTSKINNSRFSNTINQEVSDLDPKEPAVKRKTTGSKRKSRNNDKGNGEVGAATNGDLDKTEAQTSVEDKVQQNSVEASKTEENGSNDIDQTKLPRDNSEDIRKETENSDHIQENNDNTVNGNIESNPAAVESMEEVQTDNIISDVEETCSTADTEMLGVGKTERCDGSLNDLNNDDDNQYKGIVNERQKENGFETHVDDENKIQCQVTQEQVEPKKGFFGKWNIDLTFDKKDPETKGNMEDIDTENLYYSSIRGRMPLNKASPKIITGEHSKDSVFFKGLKTPTNVRNLNDSFGVKSEPTRANQNEIKEKPNLRKFPAKRCLNADESDEKEDSFLSNLSFTKRRKVDDAKSTTGFLKSFLWSPFKKRINGSQEMSTEKPNNDAAPKSSWFRSPFWFLKRYREEERN